jgi:protein involved in polysaccharide export with SLBB domain
MRCWWPILIGIIACSGSPSAPTNLPAAEVSRVIGPDDMFTVSILGEKDLPTEFQVQPDGTIDFPYLGRLQLAGLEPQGVVDLLRKKLEEAKILRDPQITLIMRQYNSMKVNIIGQVGHQDTVPWTPGMTLLLAVTHCGGFTPMADSNHVVLIRRVSKDKNVKAVVSVDAIMHNAQPDVPLQPGDTVIVEQRTF